MNFTNIIHFIKHRIAVITLTTIATVAVGSPTQASVLIDNTYNHQANSQLLSTAIHQALRHALEQEGLNQMIAVDHNYANPNWDQQFRALRQLVGLANNKQKLYLLLRAFSQNPNQVEGQIRFALVGVPDDQIPSPQQIQNAIALVNSFNMASGDIANIATFFDTNYNHLRNNN